jgi:hypothetical protein
VKKARKQTGKTEIDKIKTPSNRQEQSSKIDSRRKLLTFLHPARAAEWWLAAQFIAVDFS